MFDNMEYENCPLCHSKKLVKIKSTDGKRIILKCGEEDCGNKIDTYPVEKEND